MLQVNLDYLQAIPRKPIALSADLHIHLNQYNLKRVHAYRLLTIPIVVP
jgi:hypothetical protein